MMNAHEVLADKSKSWEIFDRRVSRSYDFVSDLISLRLYRAWCKALAKALPDQASLKVLDLASGTGIIPFTIHDTRRSRDDHFTCVDLSEEMLEVFREKVSGHSIEPHVELVTGDATALEMDESHFDVVTMACGLRNVGDTQACLSEILRVLKPGGAVYFLEPSMPQSRVLKAVFLGYFRHVVPRLAGLFSTAEAYRYFNQSVENFPHGEDFIDMVNQAGFTGCTRQPLTFGAGSLYVAEKPQLAS